MKDMKRTLVNMILAAVLCAVAGKSWAQGTPASISKGTITGGTVKIYGESNGSIDDSEPITSSAANSNVYIVTEADAVHKNTDITWHVVKSTSSSHAESRTLTPDYAADMAVTYVEPNTYKITMPADGSNVTVNAVFAEKAYLTGVDYVDATGTATTTAEGVKVYVLDGSENTLGEMGAETWYVSNTGGEGLAYSNNLTLLGAVRIILADNSKMAVTSSEENVIEGSYTDATDFTIYGQAGDNGILDVSNSRNSNEVSSGIFIYCNMTICGGNIKVSGANIGINSHSYGDGVVITGGTVTAFGASFAIDTYSDVIISGGNVTATGQYGIYAERNVVISGGNVTATGQYGISAYSGSITLGWTNPDDCIYASSYHCDDTKLMTAAGQRFIAFNTEKEEGAEGFNPADTKSEASAIVGSANSTDAAPIDASLYSRYPVNTETIIQKTLRPLAYVENGGQGGTTFSPGFLLSIESGDIEPEGRTAADFTIGTTPYYIYKEGNANETIPLSVPNYAQTGADFTVSINGAAATTLPDAAVTGSGQTVTAALPWTGANDVKIEGARYYCTGVKYLEWQDAEHPNVEKTTPTAAGNTTKVYILTGNENINLPGGWYVVKNWNTDESVNSSSDAFFTGTVYFTGDTHLILADGARMDVGSATTPFTGDCIHIEPGNLSIYAQSTGDNMGQLNTFAKYGYDGIYASPSTSATGVTIHGGSISCTVSNGGGIMTFSSSTATSITINGGNISCSVNNSSGIIARSSNADASVTINGGNITCDGNRGTGLMAESGDGASIITINEGNVTVKGNNLNHGLFAYSNASCSVTINDGYVDLSVQDFGIYVYKPTLTSGTCSLAIYGGNVKDNSNHGINVSPLSNVGELILGWKNPDDYVYTTNYDVNGTVRTVSGKRFVACTPAAGETPESPFAYIEGGYTITPSQLSSLAGKKLMAASEPVKYLAWDDSEEKLVETNTADDNNAGSDFLYVLQGTETEIGTAGQETFYLASGTLDYNPSTNGATNYALTTNGDTHLILADDATMTISDTPNGILSLKDENQTDHKGHLYIHSQGGTAETAEGTLNVSVTNDNSMRAIYSRSDLTIDGGIITATVKNTDSYDIFAFHISGNLAIHGGSINVTATKSVSKDLFGIACSKNVTITNSDISVTATNKGTGKSCALDCEQILTVSGGKINVTALSEYDARSTGIYCLGGIDIGDATIIASGTCKGSAVSYGIHTGSTLTIDKSTVEATAVTEGNAESFGILAEDAITFTSATVTASGTSKGSGESHGIYAKNGLTIDKGTVTATAEMAATGTCSGIECYKDMTATYADITAIGNGPDHGGTNGIIVWEGNLSVKGGTLIAKGLTTGGVNDYSYGISCYKNDVVGKGNVTIEGGNVTIEGGAYGIQSWGDDAAITLDWLETSDFIHACSYSGTVKIPAGRYFANFDNNGSVDKIYGNATTAGDYTFGGTSVTIGGDETLRPVSMIPTNPDGGLGEQYIGYSEQEGDMALVGGAAQSYAVVGFDFSTTPAVVYTVPVSGIPMGSALVLGPAGADTALPDEVGVVVMSGSAATAIENSFASASPLRNFIAAPADGVTTLDQQIAQTLGTGTPGQPDYVPANPADYIAYMIVGGSFRPVSRTAASVQPANTAVLAVSKIDILTRGTVGTKPNAARRITLGDTEATGINSMDNGKWTMENGEWFSLDGRRLTTAPKAKGVYIRNGEKVIVR